MTSSAINGAGDALPQNRTLLPHIVDRLASKKPQALYAEFPNSPFTYDEGYRKLNYGTFANAVNGVAWWLHETLGPSEKLETLAYIGLNNILYPVLVLGAIKAGYNMLLLSPRNSMAAQLHLIESTNCKTFLTPTPNPPSVTAILAAHENGLRVLEVPTVEKLLSTKVPHYPYNKTYETAYNEPFVILHTSGSTGLPKPMIWTHAYVAAYSTSLALPPPPGFRSVDKLYEGNRFFVIFPPFHAAYIAEAIINAIVFQSSVILPLQSAIPSAGSLSEALKNTKIDAAFVVPSILEEMSKSPELLDYITANLDTLVYSGGDLPLGCGNLIASKVQLINFYGSTEGASLPQIRLEEDTLKEDWKYLHVHPDANVKFHHSTENMYELYVVRDDRFANNQQVFKLFPNLQEFQTRDLFIPHPTKPDRWSHCGRSDDIVVLLNGEKTCPVPMEQHILASNLEVNGALVAGSQRFQTSLVVELSSKEELNPEKKAEMIEKIWPSVEEANKECAAHAQLAKSHIMFMPPDRPMIRTPKGTIMRAASLALYVDELDALYEAADNTPDPNYTLLDLETSDSESTLSYVRSTISKITSLKLSDVDNFFEGGMDSLQALLIARNLKQVLKLPDLSIADVYANPSIFSLMKSLGVDSERDDNSKSMNEHSRAENITVTLAKYTSLIDDLTVPANRTKSMKETGRAFLLTGSTGALGSYVLQNLLSTPEVGHVYCLNRSADGGADLQVKRNQSRGLTTKFPKDRVTFLCSEVSKPNFGLSDRDYQTLSSKVTSIIHNAWPVNFNLPLSSFEPQLVGVVNLVKFANESSLFPSIVFISSISAVSNPSNKTAGTTVITEDITETVTAPAVMGYGESKYLSERVLDHAAKKKGLQVHIARVGQIAGPLEGPGIWNRDEWIPSLIISSLFVSAVPESLGKDLNRVDWIPIDTLAEILLEISEAPKNEGVVEGAEVFNLINPRHVQWEDILPTVVETLSSLKSRDATTPIQTVHFDLWISKVEEKMNSDGNGDSLNELGSSAFEDMVVINPAVKLIDFYREEAAREGENRWETERAERRSGRLRGLGEVEGSWVRKWVRGWFEV